MKVVMTWFGAISGSPAPSVNTPTRCTRPAGQKQMLWRRCGLGEDFRHPDDMLVGFSMSGLFGGHDAEEFKGLRGKKGVLWWQIERILREKEKAPRYLFWKTSTAC